MEKRRELADLLAESRKKEVAFTAGPGPARRLSSRESRDGAGRGEAGHDAHGQVRGLAALLDLLEGGAARSRPAPRRCASTAARWTGPSRAGSRCLRPHREPEVPEDVPALVGLDARRADRDAGARDLLGRGRLRPVARRATGTSSWWTTATASSRCTGASRRGRSGGASGSGSATGSASSGESPEDEPAGLYFEIRDNRTSVDPQPGSAETRIIRA